MTAHESNVSAMGFGSHLIKTLEDARQWLQARNIEDIECVAPDIAGVPRGKMMPTNKFYSGPTLTMPSSIFAQTISGGYPSDDARFTYNPTDGDLYFRPDYSTLAVVPWGNRPNSTIDP